MTGCRALGEVDPLTVGTGCGRTLPIVDDIGVDPLPAAPAVDRQVAGHPDDPCFGVAPDSPPADKGAGHGLLGDVFRFTAPAEQLVGHAVGTQVEISKASSNTRSIVIAVTVSASVSSVVAIFIHPSGTRGLPGAGVVRPPASLPREEYARGPRKVDMPLKKSHAARWLTGHSQWQSGL